MKVHLYAVLANICVCIDMNVQQEAGVERRLLQVEENFITASPLDCCVVEVAVQDLGAWVVKFRENGVIFNRK
jgi:hypothetical protein